MPLSKSGDLKEQCNKAAHLLEAFLDGGKIPRHVIQNARGIAIFSAFRAGMYFAGTAGSGIVLARLADGSWSPPSAFAVRAGGVGIVYGADYYDSICVLNTQAAVDAYCQSETRVGGGMAIAAGPLGKTAEMSEKKEVSVYTKSRGLYGGITIDGTVIKEKPAANEEFYGLSLTARQVLDGEVPGMARTTDWRDAVQGLWHILEGGGKRNEVVEN